MEYIASAYSEMGKDVNQDSAYIQRALIPQGGEILIAVICDGMGGLCKGEVASKICIDIFEKWFEDNLNQFYFTCGNDFVIIRQQWNELVEQANNQIFEYSKKFDFKIGTTISAFLVYAGKFLTLTIGDSRIYGRKNNLCQLTQDQSLVEQEVLCGNITKEQAQTHPQNNILLQCVDGRKLINPVYTTGNVISEELFLICSDGLSHKIKFEELNNELNPILLNNKNDLFEKAKYLVDLCRKRGEKDDISIILIKAIETPIKPKKNKILFKFKKEPIEINVNVLDKIKISFSEIKN